MLIRLSLLALLAATTTTAWVPSSIVKMPTTSRMKFVAFSSRSNLGEPEEPEQQQPEAPEPPLPAAAGPASYDEAGAQLMEAQNKEQVDMLGQDEEDLEFEEKKLEYEAMREKIRKRTADLGIEKSKLTAQLIEEANARAAAGQSVQGLDLSKINITPEQQAEEEDGFDLPSFMFDPEDELTEEEKLEIDPVSAKSWKEQVLYELEFMTFPDFLDVAKEVALVVLVVVLSAFFFTRWDQFIRYEFTEFGLIPRPDETVRTLEGLDLPEKWTDMMSEQDISTLPTDVAKDTSATIGKEIGSSQ